MPLRARLIALPLVAASIAAAGAAGSPPAQAASRCHAVHAGGHTASAIRTNIGCSKARRMLRRWLRRGHLPHHEIGWYCAGRRHVTCGGGNGGSAPYIRFHRR